MEYITTTIGILSFIGILYGLVKMLRESGHGWEWTTSAERRESIGLSRYSPLDPSPGNLLNDD